ncbi:Tim44/TimA family putative adaptor protein [Altererythrobacter gangjinensis]|uniref:Tim44/TimA family putative adaptor protein n=2 Tax=Pontixanthobacter gangjinensis TaxID=1028742 RepID=A0A6I4SK40_9SPHN|nr:Tim44/TimA family putative adaptor protein [Pontixanthobacter gangjinensis]
MVEIVILAMVAAFLGLRLYSVLGQRAEHEEESIPTHRETPAQPRKAEQAQRDEVIPQNSQQFQESPSIVPAVERGVREIAAADRSFDITSFIEGAKAAYAIILEAFWKGDRETLRELCDSDVYESFDAAITMREKAGEKLDNRLIRIEESVIDRASLDGKTARLAVRFVADIAAVTYDKDGTMIAGSLDDAIESRDVWTFMRDINSSDQNWLLDETDEG